MRISGIVVVAFGMGMSIAHAGAREAFCNSPLVHGAVAADAKRQKLLNAPLVIQTVRFSSFEQVAKRKVCIYTVVATNGEKYDFRVSPAGQRGPSLMRFKFQFMD